MISTNDKSNHKYHANPVLLYSKDKGEECNLLLWTEKRLPGRIPSEAKKGQGVECFSAGACLPPVPASGFS